MPSFAAVDDASSSSSSAKPAAGWKTAQPPSTPAQINRFFDACTTWLLAQRTTGASAASPALDVVDDDDGRPGGRGGPDGDDPSVDTVGISDDDARFVPSHRPRCVACHDRDATMVVVNPYAHACLLYLCAGCRAGEPPPSSPAAPPADPPPPVGPPPAPSSASS